MKSWSLQALSSRLCYHSFFFFFATKTFLVADSPFQPSLNCVRKQFFLWKFPISDGLETDKRPNGLTCIHEVL